MVSECTPTSDRVCQCKAGFYNLVNGACSQCTVCNTDSAEMVSECTTNADRVCQCKAGYTNLVNGACTVCTAGSYFKTSAGELFWKHYGNKF